ncbi:hypothetical protein ACSVH7_14990, partial [Flavobacterium sp. TSSA_36]
MKKNFALIFILLLSLFWTGGNAQTQFWSDTFEDTGAPSTGTRTPSIDIGFPSNPFSYYFMRTDGNNLAMQNPIGGLDTFITYQNIQGTKFWAGEDTDRARTGITDINDKIQNITWTGINIAGKTGLSFKGLFAAYKNQSWQNPAFGPAYDFLIIEYRIDGGAWTRVGGFNGDTSATNAGYLSEDTDGDNYGDGTQLSKTFQEFNWNISGTGTTLDLRFRVSADGSANQEFAVDNFRLFEVPACTAPVVTASPSNQSICNGGNITFSATATGATAYQWQVNTGSGFTDITNSGVYSNATTSTLTITGATSGMNGFLYRCVAKDGSCSTNSSSGVLSVTTITLTAASQTNVACNGGSTGAATVNAATGGTGPYTYNWTPGTPTGDGTVSVTGLTPGVWTCTVTDNNGCSTTRDFTITQPTAISTATAAQTNVSCNGGSNGSASVTPSGGAGGYTYSWSPSGGTAATATGLSAGTYTVTVTDANACTATRNFTITQPTIISTATAAQTNVSCNGGANGSASVTPSGGAGGYTYSWSPSGGTAATATGLSAGTYTVTVTDANACTATRNFTITQPTTISTATASQTNVSCNGGSNGSASVTPSGGAGGYTYSWSPSGGTAATATGLSAGTYTVTVTDANSCTATRNFTITQPTAISTATTAQTNVSCNGGSNGSAYVTPSGGAGGYTYSWSPSGGTAATATGLNAGTYTVTVTDANACSATRNFTITQPTVISTATAAQTNVSCNGGSNGSASVTPSGGAGGYTYSWSPSGGTAATATGLSAGTYTVTVTDANSCTATRNFTITQPTAISTATAAQTNV